MDMPMWGATNKSLSHEVGHCLGLWHPHHSPDEVAGCSDPCYEFAGSPSNTTGDFCSDTAPTPTNYNCSDPPGSDPCTDPPVPWAPTNYRNFMGWAGNTILAPEESIMKFAKLERSNSNRGSVLNFRRPETIECRIFRGTLSKAGYFGNLEFLKAVYDYTKTASMNALSPTGLLAHVKKHPGEYKWFEMLQSFAGVEKGVEE